MNAVAAWAAGLIVVLVLSAGGCAGDDVSSTSPSSLLPAASAPTVPATSVAPASPPPAAPATQAPEPPTSVALDTAASLPPTSPPTSPPAHTSAHLATGPFADLVAPTTQDYCAWATHADALFERWMELARTPTDNEAYLATLQPTWDQMRNTAPDELDPHFDVVTATYTFVWESLADSGFDIAIQQAEHGDEILALRDQTFLAAAHTIDAYGYDTCGITPP